MSLDDCMDTTRRDVLTLELSPRDIQWLAALTGVSATLLNPIASNVEIENNMTALHTLYVRHYSADEGDALAERLRALLPPNTPVRFVPPTIMAPEGLVS